MKIDEAQPHRGSKELNKGPAAQALRGHDEGRKMILSGNHPHMTCGERDDMIGDSDERQDMPASGDEGHDSQGSTKGHDGHAQPHRGNEGPPKGPLDLLTMTL